jgi:hypothetical protein
MGFILPEIVNLSVMNRSKRQTRIRRQNRKRLLSHGCKARIGFDSALRARILRSHPFERLFSFHFLQP